ncbi:MAG: hypothetical protein AAFR61_17640 [Bacteroidota bacterium]
MRYPQLYDQLVLQSPPEGFEPHQYSRTFIVKATQEQVWIWLNTPETFTKGQVWPYRVEFVSPDPVHIPADFSQGVLNVHHGPLMSFAGVLTDIQPDTYRDIRYFYGSYFLSMRWIRPTRLQFWLEGKGAQTEVKVQIDSFAKPFIAGFWTWAQGLFWGQFGRLSRKAAKVSIGHEQ